MKFMCTHGPMFVAAAIQLISMVLLGSGAQFTVHAKEASIPTCHEHT